MYLKEEPTVRVHDHDVARGEQGVARFPHVTQELLLRRLFIVDVRL